MKIVFDKRVLSQRGYSGVKVYVEKLNEFFKSYNQIKSVSPKSKKKIIQHLWLHFILPFYKSEIIFSPSNISPLFNFNKKNVLTLHDVAFIKYPDSFSFLFRNYYKFLMPIILRKVDKIITVSEFSKREIANTYPFCKEKIEVIYLGVEDIFRPLNIAKKKQILYVGSLNERKNFLSTLIAFSKLNQPEYNLVIVGNFDSNFKLNKDTRKSLNEAMKRNNIIFKKNVSNEELNVIYNESEVLLFPSFYEGFGFPALEAMKCGTCVITTNDSSMQEICGASAHYVNSKDEDEIYQVLKKVLSSIDQQKDMIELGIERAKDFTWAKTFEKHLNVLFDSAK